MENSTAQGIILGVVLALLAIAVILIRKLFASRSEGARRMRWVLGALVVLFLGSAFLAGNGDDKAFFLIVVAVIAVVVWIYRGFKQEN